ncbi:hypothetical protein GOV06_02085 [Candidatus Woesearchaeota archaeon]|nr:hypothetical protein [Candidatus Woesearchaeota archaeon]
MTKTMNEILGNLSPEEREVFEKQIDEYKLQGVRELAGAVCHEVNQPLQGVLGFTDILLLNMSKENPVYRDLKKIKEQAERIAGITMKLHDIKRYATKIYEPSNRAIIDIDKAHAFEPEKEEGQLYLF